MGSKLTVLVRGFDIDSVRAEIGLFSEWSSSDSVFVWVVEVDLVFSCGLHRLVLVRASKLT